MWVVATAFAAGCGVQGNLTIGIDAGSTPDGAVSDDASVPPDDAPSAPDAADDGGEGSSVDAFGDVAADASADPGADSDTDAADMDGAGGDGRGSCGTCAAYGAAVPIEPVPAVLTELSGIAASHVYPDIFYAHNDSGDTARFFALDDEAEVVAEFDLIGAVAADWEDIAAGPCPSGSCVYIGDIGDNNLRRTEYAIYRVAEPASFPPEGESASVVYERFPFVYPDGVHNAETLLVHPSSGRIFVVTKVGGVVATVYEMPQPLKPNETVTLSLLMPVSLPALAGVITGGSFHPCGNRILLRTYGSLYELSGSDNSVESIFAAAPVEVPVAPEAQGEAVSYAFDGRGYVTSGETLAGVPAANLSAVSCR